MIDTVLYKSGSAISKIVVSGHAGYADSGEDIVCAAISSAVQLTANAVSEVAGLENAVFLDEKTGAVTICSYKDAGAKLFLEALELHISLLAQQYPKNIKITSREDI